MITAPIRAIEFFSGIGAFSSACKRFNVEIIAAYDQGQDANRVYELNSGLAPSSRNLDTIGAAEIPDADIWWLSPPCTPYTVRGLQHDDDDNRALSLKNLIQLLSDKLPPVVFVENVIAFERSRMFSHLTEHLRKLDYKVTLEKLCPTDFGVPMKRPRIFITATREPFTVNRSQLNIEIQPMSLAAFVNSSNTGPRLPDAVLSKHGEGMHIVKPTQEGAYAICFTSGYAKTFRASGSFIEEELGVRRFSPDEILSLLGFPSEFQFPIDMDMEARWRLVGNSVDVRSICRLIHSVEANGKWVELLPE